MSNMTLKGKNAIVTGSTRGIGRAIAKALAENGCNVIITSRSQEDCDRVAGELSIFGSKVYGISADLSKSEARKAYVGKVLEKFGKIDVLVNNAGTSGTTRVEDITEEEWDRIVDLNLKSVFFLSQEVGKEMIKAGGGRIINIASVLGMIALKGVTPYSCAKAGLLQMTRSMAYEWAKKGIIVNSLCPGYVLTDINREVMSDPRNRESIERKTPLSRFGEAEEIAKGVVFLASDECQFMTGQNMIMDGGYSIL